MKTILISGGAGYLGTELTKFLLKKHNIIVYDKFYFSWLKKNKNKLKFKNRLKFIKKGIDEAATKDFSNVDIVCDLNGIPNDPSSEINPKQTWDVNFYGRYKFAKKAKQSGVKRYIFNSTCAVYGYNKKKVFEKSKKNPISTYARANYKAEKFIYNMRSEKFKVNVFRNSTLFGFSNALRLDLVINIFVYNLIKNQKILIDGNGDQYRPFIAVKDICRIYDILISKKKLNSFICNLVSFNSKIKPLAFKIIKILGKKRNLIELNKKFYDNRNYFVDSSNFRKYFKYFKFSNFKKEILNLKKNIIINNIKKDKSTVRVKFYKRKFKTN